MVELKYVPVRDRESKAQRAKFNASIKIEREFARHLKKIADQVGSYIDQFDANDPSQMSTVEQMLRQYAELIKPWAKAVSGRMLTEASRRDEKQWKRMGAEMSESMTETVSRQSPVGKLLRALLDEQVSLIQSIPLDAAKRVHKLTIEGLSEGVRAKEIADKIKKQTGVSTSKAMLIARTEVARTSSLLTQTRASMIGSEGYIWRTSKDQDVRKSHKQMEGKFVRWDSPPTLSDGTTTHAGQIYNCRCYPEPVIPENL